MSLSNTQLLRHQANTNEFLNSLFQTLDAEFKENLNIISSLKEENAAIQAELAEERELRKAQEMLVTVLQSENISLQEMIAIMQQNQAQKPTTESVE